MPVYHLAIDIGASGGRHILGWLEEGRLVLQEIYRFENGMENKDGFLCWDTEKLFAAILKGLKKCRESGRLPTTMGIDTWAVDFVLLDQKGKILGNSVGYRDRRTIGMDRRVCEILSEQELYRRTGIQKQIFNTIYQLMAVKEHYPEHLQAVDSFLMIPDYFHYLLTGKKCCEYTNATTTQLVSPVTQDWDGELLKALGFPIEMFPAIVPPGTCLGGFRENIQREVGFDCQVILPATHDTGSAVLAVPAREESFLYISSGTWSLIGTERPKADCSEESREANLTNEGGYGNRFRYLKNIMGLWMIQSVKKELEEAKLCESGRYSYGELCRMAEECREFPSRVDVDAPRFLAPKSMTAELQAACRESGQPVPESPGELATVIYQSLAESYKKAVKQLECLCGQTCESIYIVGGGSHADYLNQLTADVTEKTIYAGPAEATALGNLLAQMLTKGELSSLEEARTCVFHSLPMKQYVPWKE
ncbi:MAG: rhamnulokinase [Lachnospiraceae bacterium]|nr:rhamnulokinase [Lachnospiraceae bacterium]